MNFFGSPAFMLIWFLVGILGFFFAVYAYIRTRKDLQLRYSVNSFTLIGQQQSLPEDFQILYKGEAISRLTASKVLLVNSGDVPITAGQIEKPLALHITNGEFLECSLSAESNKANEFKLTRLILAT
jgi:hypothetical protein